MPSSAGRTVGRLEEAPSTAGKPQESTEICGKKAEFVNFGFDVVRIFFRRGVPHQAAFHLGQAAECHLADEKRPDSFENVGAPTPWL
ncbi:MAG: hypothetical protein CBC48_14955 [bacterium TMED88]|nr:hypothetical protein [Deltaproteobacteria bacterium]OUV26827.1 MAG: hypothetical protein CBC48_14955 [bacterium TMED88]